MPNSRPYILVSFSIVERDNGTVWQVFGHHQAGSNECLGEFQTEEEAMRKSLSYSFLGVPAIRGSHHVWLLEKLV